MASDGLVFRDGDNIELLSRNQKRLNHAYPGLIAAALKQKPESFVMDGEIAAFENGISSFSLLRRRGQMRVEISFYAFDLAYLNGRDLRHLPRLERKTLLKENFRFRDPLYHVEHREREGEVYFQEACKKGLGRRGRKTRR